MGIVESILGTVLGGVILALIFFLVGDYLFRVPDLNGSWKFVTTTETTAYNPYQGMRLNYTALMWMEGNKICGTGEKIREVSKEHERSFVGKHRSQIRIQGYVTKTYFPFSKDRVVIHYEESSDSRDSSSIHLMKVVGNNMMKGRFSSTIADQSGSVEWVREEAIG